MDIVVIVIIATSLLTALYLIIGIGVSKMVAKVKNRGNSMRDVVLWPISAVVYAILNDIQ